MLIQRIRQNIMASPTEVTRLASSKLLRQYFVKNQSQHQAEINMLSGGVTPMMAAAQSVASASGLPGDDDLCWQRIINGSLKIDTSEVGLQMMMQRVRLSVERNPTEDSRIAGSRILHQYFSKHQARLQAEIQQLGGSVPPISSAAAGQVLAPPAVSSAVWQEIISGQKSVATSAVGLQMMMERVRLSVERNPSEASQKAGIKILHQFFTKHQSRLQSEIQQLGGTAATGQTLAVPAVSSPIWQAIITGQKTVDTSAVGLQMMMERVRLSVERNPSETSQKAGIRILHQFFTKHQNRLQSEIRQLGGTAATGQAPGVPAVSSPIWQAIITGQKTVDTSAVGLQMMMERVRLSVERNPSEISQKAGIKILHQFFTKHQSRLQSEVQQLGGTAASASITQTVSVPADTHPSWQRLINGELEIKTDVVALKMMLERIRMSIENNPSDASRIAGAKILRQYFLKHQSKHQAELDQLLAA
jgi:alkylated DNA nucleotide flippase Atl1